jgi:4-amino-4-deoxy-L-arabinose transferase-like glycosyltransferase
MTATSQRPVVSPLSRHLNRWEAAKPSAATFWPWLLGITVAAFLLRILYLLTIAPPLPGLADEAFYYHASDLIVQGHGYSQPLIAVFYGLYRPTALHPPLWSAVLSIVSLFTAPANDTAGITGTAVDIHRGLTCLCGAIVVLFAGLLGRRIGGWRVGLLAAVIAALYPHFIALDGDLMSEPVYGAIVGGLLLLSYRFVDGPTRGRAFALGVLAALAALTRAEGLWFIPVLLLPLAWKAGRDRVQLAVFAVLGALVLLVPWTVRNYAAFHRFVPVANSGAVIAGANNSCTYYGSHLGSWQGACATVPNETNLSPEIDISSRQTTKGIDYARDHAGRAVVIAGIRLLRVWSLYDPNYQAIGEPTVLDLGLWVYYVMLPAAVYGLVALYRRGRRILILIAPAIVTSIAAVLGDGPDRLRYDAELPLIAVAAWTFVLLYGRARRAYGKREHAGTVAPPSDSPSGEDGELPAVR